MRKTILIAEYCRLREIEEVLDLQCPVCAVTNKLKKRHISISCCAESWKTACHPNVQARCKKITDLVGKLETEVSTAVFNVEQELYNEFDVDIYKRNNAYRKFQEQRGNEE